MSKNTKRQMKLHELFSGSSTKKKKETNNNQTSFDDIPSHVNNLQSTISDKDLELLKQFDLDMSFGPCTGITRLQRYERALRHDLEPPPYILELLKSHPNDPQVTHCIWRDYTL